MVHGRTQSALSQVYACKYAHSRLNHRHSNGYSRDLFFFGVVGALLGYNYEKSEAPEREIPPNPRRKKVRGGSIRGFAGQGFANPHTAELWQKTIFPEYSLRMAKKCPTYAGSQKGVVANPHKPKTRFCEP